MARLGKHVVATRQLPWTARECCEAGGPRAWRAAALPVFGVGAASSSGDLYVVVAPAFTSTKSELSVSIGRGAPVGIQGNGTDQFWLKTRRLEGGDISVDVSGGAVSGMWIYASSAKPLPPATSVSAAATPGHTWGRREGLKGRPVPACATVRCGGSDAAIRASALRSLAPRGESGDGVPQPPDAGP